MSGVAIRKYSLRLCGCGRCALVMLLVSYGAAEAADNTADFDTIPLFTAVKHGPARKPTRVKLPADFGTNRFFDKRAREKLNKENAVANLPTHPLAVGRDREALVICEAGCTNEAEQVVFSRPRIELKQATFDGLDIFAVVMPDEPSRNVDPRAGLDCMAGCK